MGAARAHHDLTFEDELDIPWWKMATAIVIGFVLLGAVYMTLDWDKRKLEPNQNPAQLTTEMLARGAFADAQAISTDSGTFAMVTFEGATYSCPIDLQGGVVSSCILLTTL